MKSFILPLASFLAATTAIDAQITFVDAVHGASGNTFKTGSILSDTTWVSTANNPTDNNTQWVTRSPWGNGDTVYQAIITNTAGLPELTTQITGLANGTYDIWAFFWDNITLETDNWILSAGLTTGGLTTYSNNEAVAGATTTGVVNADSLSFSNSPLVSQISNSITYNMFGVKLGQVVVTGGTVDVFVDKNIVGSNATQNRAWYDGVGYELITPGGDTFANWISSVEFGLAPGDQNLNDDPDGDGNDNGVENFFGTNPGTFSQGIVANGVSGNQFSFTHPQGTLASDLTASYRWTKDLVTFHANGATDGDGTTVTFTLQPATPTSGNTTVTAAVTGTATGELFMRVEVSQN